MKPSYLVLITLIACLLLVGGVQATAFSDWSSKAGCWTATNDTHTRIMWNATTASSWTVPYGVNSGTVVVVGGGGGGATAGGTGGGGGGAGGVLKSVSFSISGVIPISVGAGGAGQSATSNNYGVNGTDSTFSTITGYGGGAGGKSDFAGHPGGSGGGAGGGDANVPTGGASTQSPGLGNAGGGSPTSGVQYSAGGGGGATAAGGTASAAGTSGNGGDGTIAADTFGIRLAGGGGGGIGVGGTPGTGGAGGGGNGGVRLASSGTAGTAGTGSGGGGGSENGNSNGGDGGSGVIILEFQTPPPYATFTVNATSGVEPFPILLTNTTMDTTSTLRFGARNLTPGNNTWVLLGTTSPLTTTLYRGNWSINLTATNAIGSNVSVQTTWVNVSSGALAPVAAFTPVTSTGVSPHGVTFTDTSTNTPTEWNWTVEGKIGNTTKYLNASVSQNPSFSFLEGNFTISLGAGNADGFDMSDQDSWVNVSFGGPVVSFSTNVTSGVNDLALYLNDTSTLSPTYWNTSWGDGDDSWTNQTSFPATNITHIYSTAGSYWINHYATNPYGTANGTPLLITVYGFANSQFSSFNTLGGVPFTTYLYDTSTNTTGGTNSWYWDLGDGNVSTAQNLYYTWNITGTYSVNHSFSNGLSTDWENKTAYVTVGTSVIAPVASFNGTPSLGANPLTEFFIDVSANTPTSWYWMFGDGSTSTDQNPQHTYTDSGFFTVNFSATNTAGTDWENKTQFVVVY